MIRVREPDLERDERQQEDDGQDHSVKVEEREKEKRKGI
jgi:hypothetical protein